MENLLSGSGLDKDILDNFTSVRRINSTDFLVKTVPQSQQQQHIRVANDTFLRRSEPFPMYEFAEFRQNELYIKVKYCHHRLRETCKHVMY